MKVLACDMCGSNNIIKQDGIFVCQSCGTKYSVEEAKKMMSGDSIVVTIDDTKDIKNWYMLARRAKEQNNAALALKYYEMILQKDPEDREANFYYNIFVFFNKSNDFGKKEIDYLLKYTIPLLKNFDEETEFENAICFCVNSIEKCAKERFENIIDNYSRTRSLTNEIASQHFDGVLDTCNLLFSAGDTILGVFGDKQTKYAIQLWQLGVNLIDNNDLKIRQMYVLSLRKEGLSEKKISYRKKITCISKDGQHLYNVDSPKKGCFMGLLGTWILLFTCLTLIVASYGGR